MAVARRIPLLNGSSTPLPSFNLSGMPLGLIVTDSTGQGWQLTLSTATVDHTTVEKCAGNPQLRWLNYTGGSGGLPSGTGLVKVVSGVGALAVPGVDYLTSCGLTFVQQIIVAVQSPTLSFTGLNGDADGVYEWRIDAIGGTDAAGGATLQFRPQGVAANMSSIFPYTQGRSPNVAGQAGSTTFGAQGFCPQASGLQALYKGSFYAKSGRGNRSYEAFCATHGTGTDATYEAMMGIAGWWDDSTTVVSHLDFVDSGGKNWAGVGTVATLWKRNFS